MKALNGTLAAAVTAALLSGASLAGAQSPTAPATTPPATTAPSMSATADMAAKHSMTGEITRVDSKKGWIHLKTSEGTMIMHFPPADLATVKKGDKITVSLALKDNGPAPKTK